MLLQFNIFFNMRVDVKRFLYKFICQRTIIAEGITATTKKTYSEERWCDVPYFPGTLTSNKEIIRHQQACLDKSKNNHNKTVNSKSFTNYQLPEIKISSFSRSFSK